MKHLFLHSEKVSPTGNVTSEGIINQLGRPKLGLLETLVREAVQNSWDAKDQDSSTPVIFGLAGWVLNTKQRRVLKEGVFNHYPPNKYLPLREHLQSEKDLLALAVYDRGTVGLGGPTRADVDSGSDGTRDFVDFLRNVGQPPDKKLAGGTYGFGKAAFYRASRARTILVHTRCHYKGKLESRFIAVALGRPFVENGIYYTGRHWWGTQNSEVRIADPIIGKNADTLAKFLNMPAFAEGERGTTILMLQPVLSEKDDINHIHPVSLRNKRTPKQALNRMAEYLLWYFWPKMLRQNNSDPAMQFEASWEGKEIHIPDPTKYPPLSGFVKGMQQLKGNRLDNDFILRHKMVDIMSRRPKQHLGQLALQQFFPSDGYKFDTGTEPLFNNLTHHTALMRIPELVVKYLPSDPIQNKQIGYAGVFVTDKTVDSVFANSEPPTHDNWVSKGLEERWHRTYVNVAMRDIKREMDSFAKPSSVKSSGSPMMPLGAFSNRLGNTLLPGEIGSSASTRVFLTQMSSKKNQKIQSENSSMPLYKPFDPTQYVADIESPQSYIGIDEDDARNYPTESVTDLLPAPTFTEPSLYISSKSNNESIDVQPIRPPIIGSSRIKVLNDGDFVLVDGLPALQIQFSISHAENADGTLVYSRLRAVIDGGGTETEPPIGGSISEVIRWIDPNNEEYAGSKELYISSDTEGRWFVVVSMPEDMMLNVDLTAEAKQRT